MTEVIIEIINDTDEVTIDVLDAPAGAGSQLLPPVKYESPGNENSFDVDELEGATIILAARAGTVKEVVTTTPTMTRQMQITGKTVTLMPGDLTTPNELFTYIIIK